MPAGRYRWPAPAGRARQGRVWLAIWFRSWRGTFGLAGGARREQDLAAALGLVGAHGGADFLFGQVGRPRGGEAGGDPGGAAGGHLIPHTLSVGFEDFRIGGALGGHTGGLAPVMAGSTAVLAELGKRGFGDGRLAAIA